MELRQKMWYWHELIKTVNEYNRIYVTGPQRSGTRYASFAIAKDLWKYEVIYSGKIAGLTNYGKIPVTLIDFEKYHEIRKVFHCPQYSHEIQDLKDKKSLVIWMDRKPEDVINSEDRIGWHTKCFSKEEKVKYMKTFTEYEDVLAQFNRNWYMKTWVWENVQKKIMKVDYLELQYESLTQTSGWLNQDVRKHFRADQITLKYKNSPNIV